ncbi:MAG: hypothetical protein V1694_08005 [Candidatus Eisenbacteria bacterium]
MFRIDDAVVRDSYRQSHELELECVVREHKRVRLVRYVHGACNDRSDYMYGDGDGEQQLWHLFARYYSDCDQPRSGDPECKCQPSVAHMFRIDDAVVCDSYRQSYELELEYSILREHKWVRLVCYVHGARSDIADHVHGDGDSCQ